MIKIHLSFWLAAAIFWIMGLGIVFLMVISAVTLHELAHIVVAKAFGCKTIQLRISALGEIARINRMDRLTPWKRTAVIAAGPACNFLLWFLIEQNMQFFVSIGMESFGFYNLILGIFNLLPIFPLDGAKLFQLWMGNHLGAMRANRRAIRIGQICCIVLMALGVVQAILYAPNFTMLLVGFTLWRQNCNIKVELTGEFYLAMLNKSGRLSKGMLPIKPLCAKANYPLAKIVESMGWDHILVITVIDRTKTVTIATINEMEIINYVTRYGILGTLEDYLHFSRST
ncbi:MAG: site-2 protease family protein [Defluviitaleaceae bacterium]|nr:site-2 protease family protein [Defluviitaleaceae bacterium]